MLNRLSFRLRIGLLFGGLEVLFEKGRVGRARRQRQRGAFADLREAVEREVPRVAAEPFGQRQHLLQVVAGRA